MRFHERAMPDDFNLYLFGDTHEGTVAHYRDGFKAMAQTIIDDPMGYGVDHGDMIEAITIDDKRYDPDTCSDRVLSQISTAIEARREMAEAGKLLAILNGNHELKLWRFGEISEHVAKVLQVPYLGYTGVLSYFDKSGGLMFKHYATHGRKGIGSAADDPVRRDANMKISLKRILGGKAGDCALMSMGHTHRLMVVQPHHALYLTSDGDRVKQNYYRTEQAAHFIHPDHRWYVNTGSFYRTQVVGADTYSEIAQYDPLELGYAKVSVRDGLIRDVERVLL